MRRDTPRKPPRLRLGRDDPGGLPHSPRSRSVFSPQAPHPKPHSIQPQLPQRINANHYAFCIPQYNLQHYNILQYNPQQYNLLLSNTNTIHRQTFMRSTIIPTTIMRYTSYTQTFILPTVLQLPQRHPITPNNITSISITFQNYTAHNYTFRSIAVLLSTRIPSTPNDCSTHPDSLWWNHTILGPVTDGVPTGRRGRPAPVKEPVDTPPPQKVSGRLPVGT